MELSLLLGVTDAGAGSGAVLAEGGAASGGVSEIGAVGSAGVQATNASKQNADPLKSAVILTSKSLLKRS